VQSSSEREAAEYQEAMLQAALRDSLSDLTGQSAAGPACSGSSHDEGGSHEQALKPAIGGDASVAAGSGNKVSGCHGHGADEASHGARGEARNAEAHGVASAEGHVVGESVQLLLSMGFSLPRAVQAHAQFGDDVESMLEYLTADQ
jgi:hypothetical protein